LSNNQRDIDRGLDLSYGKSPLSWRDKKKTTFEEIYQLFPKLKNLNSQKGKIVRIKALGRGRKRIREEIVKWGEPLAIGFDRGHNRLKE